MEKQEQSSFANAMGDKKEMKMKKLLFMIAAVVAVATAQAAYVDWQYAITDAKTTSGGTDWTSGYTAYLLTASDWATVSAKDSFGNSEIAAAALDSSGFFAAGSTKSAAKYSTGAAGSAGIRQVEADSGNYYVILTSATGYDVVVNNVSVSAYADGSGAGTGLTPNVTIDPNNAVSASGLSFTTFPSGGGSDPSIPEPTSGLLLALGGAMLALRRRRA